MWGDVLQVLGVFGASGVAATALGVSVGRLRRSVGGDTAPFEQLLPYDGWVDDTPFLRTERGGMVAVFSVVGATFASMKTDEQDRLSKSVKNGLSGLISSGAVVRLFAVRDPVRMELPSDFSSPVLRVIAEAEAAAFHRAFLTRRFVVASWPTGKAVSTVRDAATSFTDACSKVGATLLKREDAALFFGNRLDPIAGGVRSADRLRTVLGSSEFLPDPETGRITVKTGAVSAVSGIVSVVGWSEDDGATIVDGLLALPHQLEVVMQLHGVNDALALEQLDRKKRVALNQRTNAIVEKEFRGVTELVQAGRDQIVKAQMWVTATATDADRLQLALSDISAHLKDRQVKPRVETRGAAPLWLGRIAGDGYDYLMRPRDITASNAASLFRMDREPEGDASSSFGPGPLRLYRTARGAPYMAQFHVEPKKRAQGHFLVVAPTTSGKTVWAQHILGGALRHKDVMALAFDRFAGMRVWAEAVGGRYIDPLGGAVGFNPLQLRGSSEDLAFLQNWLCQAARVTDEVGELAIAEALVAIFNIKDMRERRLDRVMTSFPEGDPIRKRLERLVSGPYANILCAETDSFALGPGLTVLDMTVILNDPESAGLLASYAGYRIRQAAKDGVPHVILADEVLPMLENPVFARVFAKEGPREHRKLDGCVGFIIQDFGGLDAQGDICQIILESCKTRILFPNPDLTDKHAERLGLSPEERDFVAGEHFGTRHMKRPFLYIRGKDRVFVDGDLSWMGELLKLYEGSPQTARQMLELQQQYGADWWKVMTKGKHDV